MTPLKGTSERRFARSASVPVQPRPEGETHLLDEVIATVCAQVPAFRQLEADEVRRMAAEDVDRARTAMLEHRLPTDAELDASAVVTMGLARAGVPLEAINRSRRAGLKRVFDTWRDEARIAGVDAAAEVDNLYTLWNWCDAIAARSDAIYRQVESEVQGDQGKRARFLRAVLDGTLSQAETERRAAAYGLLPGARYLALRARPSPEGDARRLQRVLEVSGASNGTGALVAPIDGDLWGLASQRPEIEDGQGVVGVGMPAELGAVASSFSLASRALEAASAYGLDGVVSIDDLALRAAVLAEDHIGDRLVRRYLGPLREMGEFGATLERTVEEYLARGMRIDESAKALIVHPNTLRHRIERFQQLTGADLRRTEDLVEVWWALQRRRVADGSAAHRV